MPQMMSDKVDKKARLSLTPRDLSRGHIRYCRAEEVESNESQARRRATGLAVLNVLDDKQVSTTTTRRPKSLVRSHGTLFY